MEPILFSGVKIMTPRGKKKALQAGNILAKQLTFFNHADAGGIVIGGSVPIILTSRADTLRTRLLSCALAVLVAQSHRESDLQ